jgi:hypothetical protein
MNTYPVTCVSGFWKVKNKHDDKFEEWFRNSLQINCPYVFFGNKETIEIVKKHRQNLPTFYVEYNIEDFVTNKYKDKMITHPVHCPSAEVNMIWNEKIFLIKKALELNPFSSDFFCWADAGICTYRVTPPPLRQFPNLDKLNALPKDKFIYSSSEPHPYDDANVRIDSYWHHISGTFIMHKNIVNDFAILYEQYLDALLDKNNIWTEQVILTHIFKDHKHLFYKLCDGYGEIIPHMY